MAMIGIDLINEELSRRDRVAFNNCLDELIFQIATEIEKSLEAMSYEAYRGGWWVLHYVLQENDIELIQDRFSKALHSITIESFVYRCVLYPCDSNTEKRAKLSCELETFALNQRDFDAALIPGWAQDVTLTSGRVGPTIVSMPCVTLNPKNR